MDITYLGHACFRLRSKEAIVLTDPYDPSTGYTLGRPSADIVTVSHGHYDHAYLKGVHGEPKVVDGPGEYEIKGIRITGIASAHDSEGGRQRGKNTMYVIEMDEIVIAHLGDLGHVPSEEQVDLLGNVDILMVPVGGRYTINASEAVETVSLIEPKVIIPMHYKTPVSSLDIEPVDRFLKEMGVKPAEPQSKLSVTKTTLPAEPTVIVLNYQKG